MYAVIETGGKQYRVAPAQIVRVEKLEAEAGSEVVFDKVLLVRKDDKLEIGRPLVAGATVRAVVVDTKKAPKLIVFKYRRRKDYHRKKGHRQWQTILKIIDIQG